MHNDGPRIRSSLASFRKKVKKFIINKFLLIKKNCSLLQHYSFLFILYKNFMQSYNFFPVITNLRLEQNTTESKFESKKNYYASEHNDGLERRSQSTLSRRCILFKLIDFNIGITYDFGIKLMKTFEFMCIKISILLIMTSVKQQRFFRLITT